MTEDSVMPQGPGGARHPLLRAVAALALALCLLATPSPLASQDTKPWSEKDTRLATEYLNLLAEKPEPGRVLDLLWDLYDKRGQTGFLLESIAAQARQQPHPSVFLIHAHLLRKAGKTAEAKGRYEDVLKSDSHNTLALRALSELAEEEGQHGKALDFIQKLSAVTPADEPNRAALLLLQGRLALAAEKPADAAAAWEQAARLQPANSALSAEVAQLLLGAGFLDKALTLYRELANSPDPARKLDALYDLSRLSEQTDHFDEAAKALRDGLALLHFKDWRYGQFFQRLVRLHERFGRLDELKSALLKAAEAKPPQEKPLADMARFAALTVDTDEQVKWLREITARFPESADYRWDLVRVLLDHDGAAEAAKLLDEALSGSAGNVAALVLLRCEAHLRLGETEQAVGRLKKLLETHDGTAELEKQVLAFAQQRSLDAVVEEVLRSRIKREPDKAESVFELASFLIKRKREKEAADILNEYAAAKDSPQPDEGQRRLRAVASFYNNAQNPASAESAARRAASAANAGREDVMQLADVLGQRGGSDEPLRLLERAWALSTTAEERTDVDERILALLSGDQAVKPVSPAEPGSEFKLPAIFTGEGFGTDVPPPKRTAVPDAVRDYAFGQAFLVLGSRFLVPGSRIPAWIAGPLTSLLSLIPPPTPERTLRAAWWCFRAEETQLAYDLISRLRFGPDHRWQAAPIEVERLLLDIALSDKNVLLTLRQLRLLSTLDVTNRATHLMRLAEQEGQREGGRGLPEAIRILEGLVRDDPQNEAVLSTLAQFYIEDGKRDRALAMWEKAVATAKGNTALLLERYAELLMAQRKHKEFIEAQMRIIAPETDVKRRREAFSRMLERLLWADVVQGTLPDEELKKRLDLVLAAVRERARRAPFEGFWHEALAAIYEKQGDAARAFAEMKQAYYTAPDTPYSLEQLRVSALKAGDQKAAIYFQKQIAAAASAKDEAGEWRQLVQLLEQDFRMGEADQVRRRLESRFSQDPTALEDLARYYAETGQDEAARRVQEQIARVRGWDGGNLLRLALQHQRLGNDAAAEAALRQLLATVPPPTAPANVPVERQPWPWLDERKAQAASPTALLTALDNTPGLDQPDRDRLRAFLSMPRGEFAEVPDDAAFVRLRAVEELVRSGKTVPDSKIPPPVMERAWALFYAGDGAGFRALLGTQLGQRDSLEAQFLIAWLGLRSHGMGEVVAWVKENGLSDAKRQLRKGLLQAACNILADDATFEFTKAGIAAFGSSNLFSNTELVDIARKLESHQHYDGALALTAAAQRNAPSLAADYALALARIAEAAGRPEQERQYLEEAWQKPLEAGVPQSFDAFLQSTAKLLRLARTAGEREQLLRKSWARLRMLPASGQGALREARLLGAAGSEDACAQRLAAYLSNGFLTARPFVQPIMGGRLPAGSQPGPRIDEFNHLTGYWDDMREWGEILRQDGLAVPLLAADHAVTMRHGGVPLGPKSNYEFGAWRNQSLLRQLRFADHPRRVRILRQFFETDDSVETLLEVGGLLESQGFTRDSIEIYRRLPERAFANVEYCEQFLRVCDSAWECGIAIAYIEKLFSSDPRFRPLNMAENLLEEKHAKFLARLHDTVRLRLFAFRGVTSVKPPPGRMAAEVPYLKELALLLEQNGDKPGALAAWEDLCKLWTQDPEASLHRARLLVEQKNPARALEALRVVEPVNLWSEPVRHAVELRVKLAAEAGLWDEVRDVMNLISGGGQAKPGQIPHTSTIIGVARVLAAHERPVDAQGLLLRAERTAKETNERFRLRLEQLTLAARDPAWQPQRDVAHVGALVRLECTEIDALKVLLDFVSQEANGPRAGAWIEVLRQQPRNTTAALMLSAFARQLQETDASALALAWESQDAGTVAARKLVVGKLLDQGRPVWAHRVATAGRGLGDSPVMVRVLHALGDRHATDELFARLVRMSFPGGGEAVEFAEAFAGTGQVHLARELYALALEQVRATGATHLPLVRSQAAFLISQRLFEQAEGLLVREGGGLTEGYAALLVDLYRGWNKLDRLPQELAKFHLPDGVHHEAVHLARERRDPGGK